MKMVPFRYSKFEKLQSLKSEVFTTKTEGITCSSTCFKLHLVYTTVSLRWHCGVTFCRYILILQQTYSSHVQCQIWTRKVTSNWVKSQISWFIYSMCVILLLIMPYSWYIGITISPTSRQKQSTTSILHNLWTKHSINWRGMPSSPKI